jgi:hypothetical protein
MFLIWGSKNIKDTEGALKYNCLLCKSDSLEICSYRKWFTFFFIPMFPCGKKDYYVECLECQNIYKFNGLEKLIEEKNSILD